MTVQKTENVFQCPDCDGFYSNPNSFRKHLELYNLATTVPLKRTSSEAKSNDDELDNRNSSKELVSKKNRLDYNSTILATFDALADTEEIKQDKLAIANLGRWKPMMLSIQDRQYHFLSSSSTVKAVMEDENSGNWYTPASASQANTIPVQADSPSLLKSLFFKS